MSRSRASAKAAGSKFERDIADILAQHVDDRIDRRVKTGSKDKGDIAGLRVHDQRVVIEAKNCSKISLGTWMAEAEVERENDDALAGLIAHKRHGKGDPLDQWVTTTMRELIALLNGYRVGDASTFEVPNIVPHATTATQRKVMADIDAIYREADHRRGTR